MKTSKPAPPPKNTVHSRGAGIAMSVFLLGGLGVSSLVLSGCSSTERAYCAQAAACNDPTQILDPVGESADSEDVCTINQETAIAILDANSDDICQQRKEAEIAWMNCVAESGCDAFDPTRPDCKDEFSTRTELAGTSQNRCNE